MKYGVEAEKKAPPSRTLLAQESGKKKFCEILEYTYKEIKA